MPADASSAGGVELPKVSAEALRQSEARYRALAEASQDMIFIIGRDGTVQYLNRHAASRFNRRPEELTGQPRAALFRDDISARQAGNLQEVFTKGQPMYAEGLSSFPDGDLWLGTWLVPMKNPAGEVEAVLGTSRDLTAHKRTEERLAKLNDCLLSFGPDALQNINRLVAFCGEQLGAGCALYNRLEGDQLQAVGSWRAPPGFRPVDQAAGHVCTDLIRSGANEVRVIRNLGATSYATTDPNVARFGLSTYVGKTVAFGGVCVGSLCVVYAHDRALAPEELRLLEIAASALGMEEERHRTALALRESERGYRLLFESNPQPMYVYDLETLSFLAVNEAAVRQYGYSRDEFLGLTLVDIRPAEDAARLRQDVLRVTEGLDTAGLWRHRRKDGTLLEAEIVSHTVLFAGRRAKLVLALDVSARRKAEEELRLRSVALESAANGIVITDRQGTVVWCNEAFCRLAGFAQREVLGQNLRLLKSGDHPPEFYRQLWTTISSGEVWRGEMVNRRKDGSHYVEEQTITPVVDSSGQVTHFIAIKQDVTDRRLMEVELRQSRERFQRMFESNPAGMGISTVAEGRFLEVNESFLRLSGFRREEVVGRTGLELGIWEDPAHRTHFMEALRQRGSLRNYEADFRDKLGRTRRMLVSVETIQLGLEPCLLFIVLDVTERKALEEQLRHSQKMEGIGQLAGGVAHDFNNILTVIQGHANLLGLQDNLAPEALESLQQISEAAERAANLTRQLLTFSRKQPLQPRVLELNEVVNNLTRMLRRVIGEDIALEFKYSPNLPPIFADAGMIEQALLNLAVNARDAMPQGGSLVIGTELAQVSEAQAARTADARPGQYACLSVRDTGEGIKPEVLPRIFEPFFTTKEVGKGTGLGLATVHGILQQHQGWIEVDSVLGAGATFRLYLPTRLPEATPVLPPSRPAQILGGHETILLVEDEGPLRELARQVLQEYGYVVWEARSGISALEVWREHAGEIDLLFTDIIMPGGLNGRELAQQLRAQKPSLKVILTSGYSTAVLGAGLRAEDRMRLLQKPYLPQALAQVVRDSLDAA